MMDTDHTSSNEIDCFIHVHARPILEYIADGGCTIDKPHIIFTTKLCGTKTKMKIITELFLNSVTK